MFLWVWIIYWMILGAWFAKQYQERFRWSELQRERTERLSTQAQLRSLRLQIDPHFLFNALNAISSQVEADPVSARNMIEHLGSLLRLTLDTNDRQLVPLFEELSFLDHYLAIQRIRFGDRLQFEQVIDEDIRHVLVPSMTIQPLVENSIRHGLSQRARGGLVRVAARRSGEDHIRITVEDDGVGLPPDWTPGKSPGLGLSITAQRLAALYPRQGDVFDIRRRKGGGTEVELRLPIHPEEGGSWKVDAIHA
jgi:LytS/YehU family sensor histidine kinase